MDAVVAASMSDPERNPAFRRRWQETCTPQQQHDEVSRPAPDNLELTGRALLEQWRRERARRGVAP